MKINDILDLFLQQKYVVSEIEMDRVDYLVMDMSESNAQLYISCPNSTEVIFKLRYLYDKEGRGTMHFPQLSIDNIEDIKPFLNELFHRFEIDNNLSNSMQNNEKNVELLKLVLADKKLPSNCSFQLFKNKNDESVSIHLTDNKNYKAYAISLRRLDSDYLPTGITSLIGSLKIYVDMVPLSSNVISSSQIGDTFSFIIPGYDLDKYPLLQKYNKIPKVHTDFKDWAKELANFPNLERGKINVGLQTLILEDELENKPTKRKSPKI